MPTGLLAAIGLVGVLSAGCASLEGGIGLPRQLDGESYPGDRRELRGVLEVAANGCLTLAIGGATHFVIWPPSAELDDQVRLPGGEVIASGDEVVGTGAFTPTAPLVADRNGYWATTIGFCAPDAAQVIVLDTARPGP